MKGTGWGFKVIGEAEINVSGNDEVFIRINKRQIEIGSFNESMIYLRNEKSPSQQVFIVTFEE